MTGSTNERDDSLRRCPDVPSYNDVDGERVDPGFLTYQVLQTADVMRRFRYFEALWVASALVVWAATYLIVLHRHFEVDSLNVALICGSLAIIWHFGVRADKMDSLRRATREEYRRADEKLREVVGDVPISGRLVSVYPSPTAVRHLRAGDESIWHAEVKEASRGVTETYAKDGAPITIVAFIHESISLLSDSGLEELDVAGWRVEPCRFPKIGAPVTNAASTEESQ